MGAPADERNDEHDDEYDLSPEDEEELMRRCDEAEAHPERLIPFDAVVPPRAKLTG